MVWITRKPTRSHISQYNLIWSLFQDVTVHLCRFPACWQISVQYRCNHFSVRSPDNLSQKQEWRDQRKNADLTFYCKCNIGNLKAVSVNCWEKEFLGVCIPNDWEISFGHWTAKRLSFVFFFPWKNPIHPIDIIFCNFRSGSQPRISLSLGPT